MANFEIHQRDPAENKDQLMKFWEEYLPGTPPGRLEWMNENPAGRPTWFLALDKKTGTMIGTISIMPRLLSHKGHVIRAGVFGDIMVDKKYRVLGPALHLPKTLVKEYPSLGYDCIYALPNADAKKLFKRAGLTYEKTLSHLVKPLSIKPYIEHRIPAPLDGIIAMVVDPGMKLVSKETYYMSMDHICEETEIDNSFDTFWNDLKINSNCVIGDRSSQYLTWKYQLNPLATYRFITVREKKSARLMGYMFFTIEEDRMSIIDLIALDNKRLLPLIKKGAAIGKSEGCKALYIRINQNNRMVSILNKCLFVDGKDDADLLFFSTDTMLQGEWDFSDLDRNV